MAKITLAFGSFYKAGIIAIGFLSVLLLGGADYLTGREVSFSIFYLFPIVYVSWYAGLTPAIIISFVSALVWFLADVSAGHNYAHFLIPYWNAFMRLGFFMIIVFLLSKLKNALSEEKRVSRTDLLTGVANNRYFTEIAANEINRLRRYNHHFSVAYIDLDNFKTVNDTYGHSMGDVLLNSVAQVFKNNTRSTDTVARIAGDEFIILMPETDGENVKFAMSRIKESFTDLMRKNKWPVTVSIGVVTFVTAPFNFDEMIGTVDAVLYGVKNSGKNDIKYEVLKK